MPSHWRLHPQFKTHPRLNGASKLNGLARLNFFDADEEVVGSNLPMPTTFKEGLTAEIQGFHVVHEARMARPSPPPPHLCPSLGIFSQIKLFNDWLWAVSLLHDVSRFVLTACISVRHIRDLEVDQSEDNIDEYGVGHLED